MPNRIIKESVCSSESIDALSWFEEVFFYRLIVNCDDFGRMDARSPILRSRLFPLKSITDKQIESALNRLATVGMVLVYEYDHRAYLQLVNWERHQQIRNQKSKYPSPEESTILCNQLISNDFKCTRNPIQSESESESNSNCMPGAETASGPKEVIPPVPPVISLPLNDKTEHDIFQNNVDEWSSLYPAVDVLQELREMKGWLNSNPTKRKTKKGINRFITNWLGREQDKGGNKAGNNRATAPSATNRFNNYPQRAYSASDYADLERKLINKGL